MCMCVCSVSSISGQQSVPKRKAQLTHMFLPDPFNLRNHGNLANRSYLSVTKNKAWSLCFSLIEAGVASVSVSYNNGRGSIAKGLPSVLVGEAWPLSSSPSNGDKEGPLLKS